MGFLDSFKSNQVGSRAYRAHVAATQLRQAGKFTEAQVKFDEAYKLYGEAYELGYRKPSAILGYAILTMQRGDFARARELMLDVSRDKNTSQEDRFTLRVNFAICQWKLGQLDKAIESMHTAAQTKKNGLVYTTLGMFLVDKAKETRDAQEALAFNREALEYDDEDPATLDNMGQLCRLTAEWAREDGDAEKAAADRKMAYDYFKKAYKIKPEQFTSAYYLALMEHENGNDGRAREIADGALRLPCTALCPLSHADFEALVKELQ